MTKEEMISCALNSPALVHRSRDEGKFAYPAYFNDKVPLKVRMNTVVEPDMPGIFPYKEGTFCLYGHEYYVWVNSYGAVSAILENGEQLGLKPGEFEVIEWHEDYTTLWERADRYKKALMFIQAWKFPPTKQFWDKDQTEPMSYAAAYGSNGERDFMRNVAAEAIMPARKPQDTNHKD